MKTAFRLLAFVLFFVAGGARAQLTLTQIQALKTACIADVAVCKPLHDAADDAGLAGYFNGSTVTFIAWRTDTNIDEIMRNGMDWARVDNLSVGKARIWDWMGRLGMLDCSRSNIRAGIDATWVGNAADLAVRATVYTHCKRIANRAEKILATGTGTDVAPATLTFQGSVSLAEASLIRS